MYRMVWNERTNIRKKTMHWKATCTMTSMLMFLKLKFIYVSQSTIIHPWGKLRSEIVTFKKYKLWDFQNIVFFFFFSVWKKKPV